MTRTFTISSDQWMKLREQLISDYGISMVLLSFKMRRELGFTPREHTHYELGQGYSSDMRLDFWDEQLQTMFLLRYSTFLNE